MARQTAPNDDPVVADDPPSGAHDPRRSRRVAAVVVGVIVLVAVVLALVVERAGDGSPPALTADTTSGPGTPLPAGLEVAAGSSLVGPAVVTEVSGSGEPLRWLAVIAVDDVDDPLTVWSAYVAQLVERDPELRVEPDDAPGCRPHDRRWDDLCSLDAASVRATLTSVPGDVTGRYVLKLEGSPSTDTDLLGDEVAGWPGDRSSVPEPAPARSRPDVGEPLAPVTVAYPGDEDEYVLLDGSELLVQFGDGSLTGGFDVLLRVTPGADVHEVAAAYAEQAAQFEGEPVPPPEVVEHGDATAMIMRPPGGAGGYSGTVIAVDQPGDDDYIVYELAND